MTPKSEPPRQNDLLLLESMDDIGLLRLTRQGSDEAYSVLYERYVHPAGRLARHLGQRDESDDVVAEAFAQILDLLKRGKGPDRAFRAYLFTTIRHESGRRAKARSRVTVTDDANEIDTAVPFGDGQLDDFERTAIRAAYESLPHRWRSVLWHLDVEGHRASDLADVMGLKPNSVSALVYRARSGLRDAYLQQHVGEINVLLPRSCVTSRDKLASVLRGTAPPREQTKVHAHLRGCGDCMAVFMSLQDINHEIGAILTPVALAGAIGGGVVLAGIGTGGAIVAPLFAWVKGAAVVALPAAAAVTVTTVVVVDVMESPQARNTQASVTRTSSPVDPIVPVAAESRIADAAARPKVVKQSPAPSAPPVLPFGAATPHGAPSVSIPPETTPTPAVPTSTPAPARASPTAQPPIDVVVDKDAIEISVGPVKVSAEGVEDTVENLLKLPSDLLSGLVPKP